MEKPTPNVLTVSYFVFNSTLDFERIMSNLNEENFINIIKASCKFENLPDADLLKIVQSKVLSWASNFPKIDDELFMSFLWYTLINRKKVRIDATSNFSITL